ncbi:efflux transporter outer membrane subunit [Marinobacter bohaiensis]|uniref:efflux transporter outer membrane subunit n=1 Tax=Marinobacter bohaiensis TaxID=2201898 RepID=UPI000DAD0044|nr:efflux transporter outer membrane subunit [Marinobacter bohaiensis]
MTRVPRILPVCALVLLGACTTLGPDYRRPPSAWLEQWQPGYGDSLQEASLSEAELAFWWRLFEDPVLERLIGILRRDNISLHVAGLRVMESRAQLAIAGSLRYPQAQTLDASGAYTERRPSQTSSGDSDTFTSYQASVFIGWEIDFWGRFRRSIETADAAFFASVANQQDAQVLLVAQLADFYYQYRITQERIAIAGQNARLQRRSFEITSQMFESGESSELDLQQAKAQYMRTLSTIPDLELLLVRIRNSLGLLLARPPGAIEEMTGELPALPEIKPETIADIPAGLLIRRPDIRVAAYQIAAQTSQIGVAEADKYPSISLFGTLGWQDAGLPASETIRTISAGPSLSWNLLNYNRFTNNVRVQDARLQQLIENYHLSLLRAAGEVDDAVTAIVKNHAKLQFTRQALAAAERSLKLATSRYQEGYADFQRVLDAQRALETQSERNIIDRGQQISAVIALYRALGGGWTDMPVADYLPQSIRDEMEQRSDWSNLLIAPIPVESDWLAEGNAAGAGATASDNP